MGETWTILSVLRWTAGYFAEKGIEQPRANAEVLLAHVLGLRRIDLYLQSDRPLAPPELARYREAVRRRAAREPAQYITGTQEFWSLPFEVSPSVLIPRPETELLVERALALLAPLPSPAVLDVGTGSGAIAVAIAHNHPGARILATDIAPDSLLLARKNAARNGVAGRIAFLCADLFTALSPGARFDLIAANPPYIAEEEICDLAPEVACHEPRRALRGGAPEGLGTILRILRDAPGHLAPGGTLLVEMGHRQAQRLREAVASDPRYASHAVHPDYAGIPRILEARVP